MVLDYSGPDLGFIFYGASLKLWIFSALLTNILLPVNSGNILVDGLLFLGGMGLMAVCVGITESVIARSRFLRVPQLLLVSSALSLTAVILMLRF